MTNTFSYGELLALKALLLSQEIATLLYAKARRVSLDEAKDNITDAMLSRLNISDCDMALLQEGGKSLVRRVRDGQGVDHG